MLHQEDGIFGQGGWHIRAHDDAQLLLFLPLMLSTGGHRSGSQKISDLSGFIRSYHICVFMEVNHTQDHSQRGARIQPDECVPSHSSRRTASRPFRFCFPSLNTTLLSMHDVKVDVFACVWETLDTDTSTRHVHDRQLNSTRKAFVTSQPWHLYGAKLAVLRIERSSQRAASVLHGLSIPTGLAKTAGRFSNSTLSHLWLRSAVGVSFS